MLDKQNLTLELFSESVVTACLLKSDYVPDLGVVIRYSPTLSRQYNGFYSYTKMKRPLLLLLATLLALASTAPRPDRTKRQVSHSF